MGTLLARLNVAIQNFGRCICVYRRPSAVEGKKTFLIFDFGSAQSRAESAVW
jgi:hypothetical protein